MSHTETKEKALNLAKEQLENLENISVQVVDYAKTHPLKAVGISLLAGVAIAQVVRFCSKSKRNGK